MTTRPAEARLRRITGVLAASVALATTLAIPLGYFHTAYSYESARAHSRAELSADALSDFVRSQPETWRVPATRLVEILRRVSAPEQRAHQRLLDLGGGELLTHGAEVRTPLITALADVSDGKAVVARIEFAVSLLPVLEKTVGAALFGLVLGLAGFLALRTYPMRALARLIDDLDQSRANLAEEVRQKERALKKAEDMGEAMRQLALHDPLTGLPNRTLFNDRLEQGILAANRADTVFAVVMMDLDKFKEVNDLLGHHIGDRLLEQVAGRLLTVLRRSDTLARLGGDEFAVGMVLAERADIVAIVNEMRQSLAPPFVVEGHSLRLSSSCGVAVAPQDGDEPAQLLQRADVAMYQAKRTGEGVVMYDPVSDPRSPLRMRRLAELKLALERRELFLEYQPKVDLRNRTVIGVEALVRWRSHGALVPPEEFISLAEDSGFIVPLTTWVLDQALKELAALRATGVDISVAVNLSVKSLYEADLPARIGALLSGHGLGPGDLVLEITESAMMRDPASALATLDRLDTMGISLAVDDFGTGYASLAYLRQLPIRELKIDRSFVANMRQHRDDAAIVRATIDLAHDLDLYVVAEGVEDKATLEMLRDLGCDAVQGDYLCRPMAGHPLFRCIVSWTGSQDAGGGGLRLAARSREAAPAASNTD